MPGALAHDANAVKLIATSDTVTGNVTGTGKEVDKPGNVTVRLVTPGTVGGTSPTLNVRIESSSKSDFSSDVVVEGEFKQISGSNASQQNLTKYLRVRCDKAYMRAVLTTGGTSPVYTGLLIDVNTEHFALIASTDTA